MNIRSVAERVRVGLQKFGFDVIKFRSLNTILAHHGVNVVLDVGGNVGQYGKRLRELGYQGKIVSFEPQKAPFGALAAAAKADGNWTAVNIGLGNADEQKTINLYTDSCMGSMLTLDRQTYIYETEPSGTETIEVRALDSIFGQHTTPGERVFLKIDTQGFEKQVLAGAEQTFSKLIGIQIEMSLTPIYQDQPQLDEMIALLRTKGFVIWQIQRGICDFATGQELEADGIFIHRQYSKKP